MTYASCSQFTSADLKVIWKARVPPKIQMFVWQCALNAVPTPENLRRRGVGQEMCCSCCGIEPEDGIHVLFSRTFSRLVWAFTNRPWSIISEQAGVGGGVFAQPDEVVNMARRQLNSLVQDPPFDPG
ncbi:UNVERIFIED_CONTAM: hypothetical protein Slati_0092400 [Sesamum latifolium]|uniref:Reverse transcriptase zinc-binding domain-containing protein n=1 Tax=Sesamum latifolium TaxID=2727402 RepID=A0AAW2Y8F2_9LAMI